MTDNSQVLEITGEGVPTLVHELTHIQAMLGIPDIGNAAMLCVQLTNIIIDEALKGKRWCFYDGVSESFNYYQHPSVENLLKMSTESTPEDPPPG